VFCAASIASIYMIKPLLKRFLKHETRMSNVDEMIGQKGIVIERIDSSKNTGLVKVRGEVWKAVSNEIIEFKEGETAQVEITKIDGTQAWVKKI
jgi:membrane protein implicated in regulation of membrane protease activity